MDGLGDNADTDDDNDGMPDTWESSLMDLIRLMQADAGLDPDGDTLDNLQEFADGTRPDLADTDEDHHNDAVGFISNGYIRMGGQRCRRCRVTMPIRMTTTTGLRTWTMPMQPTPARSGPLAGGSLIDRRPVADGRSGPHLSGAGDHCRDHPLITTPAPGVVQIRNVTATAFEIRFREWSYTGDPAHGQETVPYLVLEQGRYELPDGSVWEAGTFSLDDSGGTGQWHLQAFDQPFSGLPDAGVNHPDRQ